MNDTDANTNPYDCVRPGNLFVGYDRLLSEMLTGLRNGRSYAILGGERCGRTSLLAELEAAVTREGLHPFKPLPRMFSFRDLDGLTPAAVFRKIYDLVARDTDAPPWQDPKTGKEYRLFLSQLEQPAARLDKQFAKRWAVILLMDDMDLAASEMPDDPFFLHLRQFLTESPYKDNFRIAATGGKPLAGLMAAGDAPLNNLNPRQLRVLGANRAQRLVDIGFDGRYDVETMGYLFELTGRHPFVLQGVLEKMWEAGAELDKNSVKKAAREFLKEYGIFKKWRDSFGPRERAVYLCLAESPEGTLQVGDIRQRLKKSLKADLDDSLRVLSYHGVIDDADPEEPEIAGALFRNWFLEENADEAIEILAELKRDVAILSLGGPSMEQAREALNRAAEEMKEPDSGDQPDARTIRALFKEVAKILNASGVDQESMRAFKEKTDQVNMYVGYSSGWKKSLL